MKFVIVPQWVISYRESPTGLKRSRQASGEV